MRTLARKSPGFGILTHGESGQPLEPGFRPGANRGGIGQVQKFPEHRRRSQTGRIAIKDGGRILFVNLNDVLAVVAQGNYVLLQRESGSYCLRDSISAMAEKLESYGFVRIHRSALVNRVWVEEIRPDTSGECAVRLKCGKQFTVSRTYKKNLRLLAELWLGNERL